ncbi:N-acetyltransferase 10 [Balamuthia mandrillaris]
MSDFVCPHHREFASRFFDSSSDSEWDSDDSYYDYEYDTDEEEEEEDSDSDFFYSFQTQPPQKQTKPKEPGPPDRPAPPKLLESTPISLKVGWEAPACNGAPILYYILEMDKSAVAGAGFQEIYKGKKRSYEVKKLKPGTTYHFLVKATNSFGAGGFSRVASFNTQGAPARYNGTHLCFFFLVPFLPADLKVAGKVDDSAATNKNKKKKRRKRRRHAQQQNTLKQTGKTEGREGETTEKETQKYIAATQKTTLTNANRAGIVKNETSGVDKQPARSGGEKHAQKQKRNNRPEDQPSKDDGSTTEKATANSTSQQKKLKKQTPAERVTLSTFYDRFGSLDGNDFSSEDVDSESLERPDDEEETESGSGGENYDSEDHQDENGDGNEEIDDENDEEDEDEVDDGTVVKVSGLPWEATPEDIKRFFSGLDVVEDELSVALNFDGRPTGDGYVRFRTPQQASEALSRSMQYMGRRYICVEPSTAAALHSCLAFAQSISSANMTYLKSGKEDRSDRESTDKNTVDTTSRSNTTASQDFSSNAAKSITGGKKDRTKGQKSLQGEKEEKDNDPSRTRASDLSVLLAMGFEDKEAQEALRRNQNMELTVEWLIQQKAKKEAEAERRSEEAKRDGLLPQQTRPRKAVAETAAPPKSASAAVSTSPGIFNGEQRSASFAPSATPYRSSDTQVRRASVVSGTANLNGAGSYPGGLNHAWGNVDPRIRARSSSLASSLHPSIASASTSSPAAGLPLGLVGTATAYNSTLSSSITSSSTSFPASGLSDSSLLALDPNREKQLSSSLWIGNVSSKVREEELRALFVPFGEITSLKILRRSQCAFVNYSSPSAATAAKRHIQGHLLRDMRLEINFSKPPKSQRREERPPLPSSTSLASISPSTSSASFSSSSASLGSGRPVAPSHMGLPYNTSVKRASPSEEALIPPQFQQQTYSQTVQQQQSQANSLTPETKSGGAMPWPASTSTSLRQAPRELATSSSSSSSNSFVVSADISSHHPPRTFAETVSSPRPPAVNDESSTISTRSGSPTIPTASSPLAMVQDSNKSPQFPELASIHDSATTSTVAAQTKQSNASTRRTPSPSVIAPPSAGGSTAVASSATSPHLGQLASVEAEGGAPRSPTSPQVGSGLDYRPPALTENMLPLSKATEKPHPTPSGADAATLGNNSNNSGSTAFSWGPLTNTLPSAVSPRGGATSEGSSLASEVVTPLLAANHDPTDPLYGQPSLPPTTDSSAPSQPFQQLPYMPFMDPTTFQQTTESGAVDAVGNAHHHQHRPLAEPMMNGYTASSAEQHFFSPFAAQRRSSASGIYGTHSFLPSNEELSQQASLLATATSSSSPSGPVTSSTGDYHNTASTQSPSARLSMLDRLNAEEHKQRQGEDLSAAALSSSSLSSTMASSSSHTSPSSYGLFGWQPKGFGGDTSFSGSSHLSMNIWGGYFPQQGQFSTSPLLSAPSPFASSHAVDSTDYTNHFYPLPQQHAPTHQHPSSQPLSTQTPPYSLYYPTGENSFDYTSSSSQLQQLSSSTNNNQQGTNVHSALHHPFYEY